MGLLNRRLNRLGAVLLCSLTILLVIQPLMNLPSISGLTGIILQRTWGGTGFDEGKALALDQAGALYIAGWTGSFPSNQTSILLLKYNSTAADLLWERTWVPGRLSGQAAYAQGVATDSAGGIYVTGQTCSGSNSCKVLLLKFNSTGNLVWQRAWGPLGTVGTSVATGANGSIYVTGWNSSGPPGNFLLKFSSNGSLTWQRLWATNELETAQSLAVDGSGHVYVAGYLTLPAPIYVGAFLLKYDSVGSIVWERTWPYPGANGVIVDSANNIFVTGSNSYAYVVKFNSTGDSLWKRSWEDGSEGAFAVSADKFGEVFVAGYTHPAGSGKAAPPDKVLLLNFNSTNGYLLGQRSWGSMTGSGYDDAFGEVTDSVGNLYVTGDVQEGPPYTLGIPSGSAANPGFPVSVGNASAETSYLPVVSLNGAVSTPAGASYYSGSSDVFLIKLGPETVVSIPAYVPILVMTGIAASFVPQRGRRERHFYVPEKRNFALREEFWMHVPIFSEFLSLLDRNAREECIRS